MEMCEMLKSKKVTLFLVVANIKDNQVIIATSNYYIDALRVAEKIKFTHDWDLTIIKEVVEKTRTIVAEVTSQGGR